MTEIRPEWLGGRIREIREQRGLTQAALAELLEVYTVTVSRWELGQRYPSWEQICRIATALGEGLESLVRRPAERLDVSRGRPTRAG